MISIKEAFDTLFEGRRFDRALYERLRHYTLEYLNKNAQYQEFFGGHLLGAHRIAFTPSDYEALTDVFDTTPQALEACVRSITTISQEFKISTDPVNQLLMYVAHRFLTSAFLNARLKEEAAIEAMMLFSARTMAILITTWFKYPIDTYTAQAVYEQLSGRYLIKKYGTWYKVLRYRAEDFVRNTKVLIRYDDDIAIVNAINDLRNRIKDMVKNIYAVFIQVHQRGVKLGARSATMIDADGEEIVKDRVHGLETYLSYLREILYDKDSFIKAELVALVERVIPTARARYIEEVLKYFSEHAYGASHDRVMRFIEQCLTLSYNYLLKNAYRIEQMRDIIRLTGLLKGYILASRDSSGELDELKALGDGLVREIYPRASNQLVAATRNAVFMYICLRAYSKHHYSQ